MLLQGQNIIWVLMCDPETGANGMLLPVIAGVLLWIMNKKSVLGNYVNSKTQNILGIIIVIATVFLGLKGILKVFNYNLF